MIFKLHELICSLEAFISKPSLAVSLAMDGFYLKEHYDTDYTFTRWVKYNNDPSESIIYVNRFEDTWTEELATLINK